jgi:hypothetical protein
MVSGNLELNISRNPGTLPQRETAADRQRQRRFG